MFARFLSGMFSCFPFSCISHKDIKYFPRDIYKNDWKAVGDDLKNVINNYKREEKTNE